MIKKSCDITGQRFGMLTVLKFTGESTRARHSIWACRCDCGEHTLATKNNLKQGSKKSCGCLQGKVGAFRGIYG